MKPILFIMLFTSLIGCDQCEEKFSTELDKLPPATQEGKNTFGCLVNGKGWVTKTSIDAVAFYQLGLLSISATLKSPFEIIALRASDLNIQEGVKYSLTDTLVSVAEFYRWDGDVCDYTWDKTTHGFLSINKLDRIKYIVSGEFEFETVLASCDTIKVTHGRFDLHYAP